MTTAARVRARSQPTVDLDRLSTALVVATLAFVPIATGWILWSAPGGASDFNRRVSMSAYDWPLALLIVARLGWHLEHRGDRGLWEVVSATLPRRLFVAAATWWVVAGLVHPSWRAVDLAFHLVGAWAIVDTVRQGSGRARRTFLWALVGLGATQAALGTAQSATGAPLGLGPLEFDGALYAFGDRFAGRGSLTHPYHLTTLLVVCVGAALHLTNTSAGRSRALACGALALSGVAIPLTFSRTALLSIIPVLVVASRGRLRPAGLALAGGLAIGTLVALAGLTSKAEHSVDLERTDSGRLGLLRDAGEIVADHPIVGVGPGRYTIAIAERDAERVFPPHNVAAHLAAEGGVPGLLLATAAAAVALRRRRRPTTAVTVVIAWTLIPFHLLDSYPHVFPVGILISACWISACWISVCSTATATLAAAEDES